MVKCEDQLLKHPGPSVMLANCDGGILESFFPRQQTQLSVRWGALNYQVLFKSEPYKTDRQNPDKLRVVQLISR